MLKRARVSLLALSSLLGACSWAQRAQRAQDPGLPPYKARSQELHDTVARLDAALFDAYNHCKIDVFGALLAEDIEFYHDRGGLTTSKESLILSIKKNVCGRVTRELLPGSIEVSEVPKYGAVQLGAHRFRNNREPGVSRFSRFVHIWRQQDGVWKLTRVISLH
jgi:hypothetical protein